MLAGYASYLQQLNYHSINTSLFQMNEKIIESATLANPIVIKLNNVHSIAAQRQFHTTPIGILPKTNPLHLHTVALD